MRFFDLQMSRVVPDTFELSPDVGGRWCGRCDELCIYMSHSSDACYYYSDYLCYYASPDLKEYLNDSILFYIFKSIFLYLKQWEFRNFHFIVDMRI